MKKEQLLNLGIDEQVAKQIMALHGASMTRTKTSSMTKINDLERRVQTLQDTQRTYEMQVAELEQDLALHCVLAAAKVRNVNIVKALLNDEKITFQNGQLFGVDEQLERLKKNDAYLFALEQPVEDRRLFILERSGE